MSDFYNDCLAKCVKFVLLNQEKMKQVLTLLTIIYLSINVYSQNHTTIKNQTKMKLNAGIVTAKLLETKDFYINHLGFGVTFENEFYLLLHTPNKAAEISFLLPNHPSQQPLFQTAFEGKGMYLTIEVDDVDKIYDEMKKKNIEIKIDIRNEPWGDRHFAIQDPNGIGIDIVKYSPQ
jgi:catechol 2,3-dioxygenase-like lactoylglutathione lyase family enzyme